MLNISDNSIAQYVNLNDFKSAKLLKKPKIRKLRYFFTGFVLILLLVAMFLPWTQNIQSKGYVTTRLPEQRPQTIQSVISGRLDKWFVREGDFVEAGDTIVYISEIKSEYFDPSLIDRTSDQVRAKSQSVQSYDGKIQALDQQYKALESAMKFKLQQTRNKIIQSRNKISIDSIDLVAQRTNEEIAQNQYNRTKQLYDKGLKSLTELQEKELKLQQTNAKVVAQENKLVNTRNDLVNLYIELSAVETEYSDKLAKSQSDKQSALSSKLDAIANTAKLENQLSNYNIRQQFYYITASQSGFITKTLKKGLGEIVKEGTSIATIVPANYDLAVEIYVKPQDLPLLSIGNETQLLFDGWPAIVISGWPESSTGLFTGEVIAIEQAISDNGYYRVLISPTDETRDWPEELRVGTGASTFILLKDVPIWYEFWRQLNGFPPDYYRTKKDNNGDDVKLKAPLKSVK